MIAFIFHFVVAVLEAFWGLLPRMIGAWLVSLVLLVLCFGSLKHRVRHHVSAMDERVRFWAKGLRYRNRDDKSTERVALSWFFRFWTNFASAPSLSFFSVAVPFAALYRSNGFVPRDFSSQEFWRVPGMWLLPGLCYAGSMLLSFVLKRVFKRVRPPREEKSFGHKLKDPSFPSGHSLTSFCFWMMNAVVMLHLGAPLAILVALGGATIVALTGLSRVYLGVHFPSDVLGGFTIGLVWCIACWIVLFPVFQGIL